MLLRRPTLLGLLLVSGFGGAIYASAWSYGLGLLLGQAANARSLVLTLVLGGIALGAWAAARFHGRIRHALLTYALVQGALGVIGLLFHRLFVASTQSSFASAAVFKWALAGLLTLPPSILLGMSLPLIGISIIRRWPQRPGATVALLYSFSGLGAVAGIVLGGFVLVAAKGVPGAIMTAALLNLAVAALVYVLVRQEHEPQTEAAGPRTVDASDKGRRWLLWAALLTGAATLFYGVAWVRMLSLVLGSSMRASQLLLGTFILGLACGALWMRRRADHVADPFRFLGFVMIAAGTAALLTFAAYDATFDIVQWALQTVAPTPTGFTAFTFVSLAITLLIVVPATFFAGTTLPLLTHALFSRVGRESAIGVIYASSTLGAIVGAFIAVHIVMPLAGFKGVIMGGALIYMLLGLSSLFLLARTAPLIRLPTAVACGIALIAGMLVHPDPLRITSGVFSTGIATAPQGASVVYLRDGKTATISLLALDGDIAMARNGKRDSTLRVEPGPATADEITMVMAAALPLSMHPNPHRIASFGFGSGLLAHALLGSPLVKEIESIEVEPRVVEAAALAYLPRVRRAFEDQRNRIVYDDARSYLAAASAPYDIIVSDPSSPGEEEASSFSIEFYERVAARLKDDGYFVQRLRIYEIDMEALASIMLSIRSQFARYALYSADDSNLLVVATRTGSMTEDPARLFDSQALREELARVGVASIGDVQQRRIGDEWLLGPLFLSYGTPANTDFFRYLDLRSSQARFMKRSAGELTAMLTFPIPVEGLVDTRDPPRETASPSGTGTLFRDQFVRDSRLIRDALLNGHTGELPAVTAREIALVGLTADQCDDAATRDVWRQAVREIGDRTTPFLSATELADIWKVMRSSPCYTAHSGRHRDWADLLTAIALRDTSEISRIAPPMLMDQANVLNNEERTFVALAASAAAVRAGASKAATAMLADTWNHNQYPRSYEVSLRQLFTASRLTRDSTEDAKLPPPVVERAR
jgi:spermidine synthase